jgi:hypothetical protein
MRAMKKEEQASLVHELGLGKRRRHTHKTGQRLSQGVMPPLDVGGFSGFFTHSCMLLMWDHRLVSRPKGGSAMSLAVDKWNDLPQALTRLFASIPNGIGDHLTALSAQGHPNP